MKYPVLSSVRKKILWFDILHSRQWANLILESIGHWYGSYIQQFNTLPGPHIMNTGLPNDISDVCYQMCYCNIAIPLTKMYYCVYR